MTALYPGAFKPPHRGHFEVVKSLLNRSFIGKLYGLDDYKDSGIKALEGEDSKVETINKVVVFIGGKDRNGLGADKAKAIWEIYAKYLPGEVIIYDRVPNPMLNAKEYAKKRPEEHFYAVTGIRGEEDLIDLKRISTFKNLSNVEGLALVPTGDNLAIRATNFRSKLLSGNLDDTLDFFPKELSREEMLKITQMLKDSIIAEQMNITIEEIFNGFASNEKPRRNQHTINTHGVMRSEDRADLVKVYNKLRTVLNTELVLVNFKQDRIEVSLKNDSDRTSFDYTPHMASLLEHMLNEGMKITPLPEIKLKRDIDEASNFFGKTAYYDPNVKEIVLYTEGRHPKDVMRSFTHEMIHHMQNMEERLQGISTSNTNEDSDLLEIEKEAYLKGNITFRNWEDSVKNPKEQVAEGNYDTLTNRISSTIFNSFKEAIVKREDGEFNITIGPQEDADIKHKMSFDVQAIIKVTDDTYSVDGGANAGYDDDGDDIDPFINIVFQVPTNINLKELSFDLKDVIRHEIEHLTQDGENLKQGKYIPDDGDLRALIDAGLLDKDEYYKLPKEVDAMIQGMYFKAKKSKTPFVDVVDDYFNKAKVTREERPIIKALWNRRLPALGIKQRL